MNGDPLESARAKIDRAQHHLQQLNSEIESTRDGEAYGISFTHDRQSDELIITGLGPRDLFNHFAIIAGEVIGQARSALEHAVWNMVPAPVLGRTGFPVFTAETSVDAASQAIQRYYDRDGVRMIDGINPAAATIIKGLQPFGPDYMTNLLYVLNEFWNRDKHRLLNFCIAMLHGVQLNTIYPDETVDFRIVVPEAAKVKDGAELFRMPHPGVGVQVIALQATGDVIFDGGLFDQKPVAETLLKLVEFAEQVITDLA
jgi:hypothetical protein